METGMDRIEIHRMALTLAEAHYSKAMDEGDYDDANLVLKMIDGLREILIAEITAADPHTTEADVRHFESWV